jgi:catechol 2,3-dioxygenase-like lactoylglutathione lyase family enzyme
MKASMRTKSLDHVALWVADRDTLAGFLTSYLGMHVIERTGAFTLVGSDARRGKLTLFAAEGPREPGVLGRVVLRVGDLDRAVGRLPEGLELERNGDGLVTFAAPEGLGLGLVEAEGVDYDLDHVVLRVPDPERAGAKLAELGFSARDGGLWVTDAHLELERGDPGPDDRPLLNHLALLVDSAQEHIDEARVRGLDIQDIKDAENTYAVFVRGPAGIVLEYVEHKPSFSLR